MSPKLEQCPRPVSVRRRGITRRWNPWGSYRIAPRSAPGASRPRAEGAQLAASAQCAPGRGRPPAKARLIPLAGTAARTLAMPHRHLRVCPAPPKPPGGHAREREDPGSRRRGGGGGEAKVADRTQVLKNREASASQSGNLGVTPLAAPRGIPAAPTLPGEYSNPNTENKEAGPMGEKLGIDTCYADCQAHACRCARGAVPCLGAAGRGRPGVDAGVGSRAGGARGGSSASPGAAKGPGAREPLGQGS